MVKNNKLTKEQISSIKNFQKNEITEYHIYKKLGGNVKNAENARILSNIANDEKRHYHFWEQYSETEIKPNKWKVFKYYWIAKILGVTFSIKLLEKGEEGAQEEYTRACQYIPEAREIVEDEDSHEEELINMIKEKKLDYVGSIVTYL
jgi:rubrerythrin